MQAQGNAGPMAKILKPTIDEDLIRQLANLLDETGLNEIEYGNESLSIRVAKHAAEVGLTLPKSNIPTNPPFLDPPVVQDPSYVDHPGAVCSPMVGVVYTGPDPSAPPFIQVGDEVSEGQTIFLIEAMKVFNPINAGRTGKITQILVDSETPVEYGEPLAIIE